MRFLDLAMALLFAFAALVQFNDPDPIRWIALYTAACVLSLVAALRRPVSLVMAIFVGAAALVWAAQMALGGPSPSEYGRMFDGWEMKSPPVEKAREASGLILVAAWMTVLGVRGFRAARAQA